MHQHPLAVALSQLVQRVAPCVIARREKMTFEP